MAQSFLNLTKQQMSQLTGSEFNSQRGSQGILLQWLWARIFPAVNAVLPNTAAQISTSLANYYTKTETDGRITSVVTTAVSAETTARTAAISTAVSAETTARNTAITAETTARTTAINNLKGYVDTNFDTGSAVTTKINNAINALRAGAPAALDTLKEIADKLALMEGSDSTVSNQLAALIATVGTKASIDSVTAVQGSVTSLTNTVTANKTQSNAKEAELYSLIKRAFFFMPRVHERGLNTLIDKKLNTHGYRLTASDNFTMNAFMAFHLGILLNRVHYMTLTATQTWDSIAFASKADFDYIIDKSRGVVVFNPALFTEAELATVHVLYETRPKEIVHVYNDSEYAAFFQAADAVLNQA
jgi:hypothetical protein